MAWCVFIQGTAEWNRTYQIRKEIYEIEYTKNKMPVMCKVNRE